jgi:hypothetical protein
MRLIELTKGKKTLFAGCALVAFAVLGFLTGELEALASLTKAAEGLGLIGVRLALKDTDKALIAAVLERAKPAKAKTKAKKPK